MKIKVKCPACGWKGEVDENTIAREGQPMCPECLCGVIAISVKITKEKGGDKYE